MAAIAKTPIPQTRLPSRAEDLIAACLTPADTASLAVNKVGHKLIGGIPRVAREDLPFVRAGYSPSLTVALRTAGMPLTRLPTHSQTLFRDDSLQMPTSGEYSSDVPVGRFSFPYTEYRRDSRGEMERLGTYQSMGCIFFIRGIAASNIPRESWPPPHGHPSILHARQVSELVGRVFVYTTTDPSHPGIRACISLDSAHLKDWGVPYGEHHEFSPVISKNKWEKVTTPLFTTPVRLESELANPMGNIAQGVHDLCRGGDRVFQLRQPPQLLPAAAPGAPVKVEVNNRYFGES